MIVLAHVFGVCHSRMQYVLSQGIVGHQLLKSVLYMTHSIMERMRIRDSQRCWPVLSWF